ncbi:MAG: STAS-like domain-containing protein [Burkholderiales bacterium]|nr:STAS-like domain-containing protein [Burkholderiales bacterium]
MEQIKINIYNAIGSSFAMEASDGQLIYDKITKLFDEQKSIMLDFQNIEMITSAFLNTAIGQLYGKYDAVFIKRNLSVENMLPEDMVLLKRVVDTAKLFYSDPERLQNSIDEILGE